MNMLIQAPTQTPMRTNKRCKQCGYHLNGRSGSVCSKCFNISFIQTDCKFCKEKTLIPDRYADNNELHVCCQCDWDHRSDLKCDKCGEIGKDALYTSHHRKYYNCKNCCRKTLTKCIECERDMYASPRNIRRPICMDCRLKNYVLGTCIKCNQQRYFHKLRKPESCICNVCFSESRRHTEDV